MSVDTLGGDLFDNGDLGRLFGHLTHGYRRCILDELYRNTCSGKLAIEEIVGAIMCAERSEGSNERDWDSVYSLVHHRHVPQLERDGFVEYMDGDVIAISKKESVVKQALSLPMK